MYNFLKVIHYTFASNIYDIWPIYWIHLCYLKGFISIHYNMQTTCATEYDGNDGGRILHTQGDRCSTLITFVMFTIL